MSVELQNRESSGCETEGTASEWQTYTAIGPSDRGGDTEVRHLRTGGPITGNKTATGTLAASPNPTYLLTKTDPGRGT